MHLNLYVKYYIKYIVFEKIKNIKKTMIHIVVITCIYQSMF